MSNKIILSESTKAEIKKLHAEHIRNHYIKVKTFWQRSEILNIIEVLLLFLWTIFFLIGAVSFLIIFFTEKDFVFNLKSWQIILIISSIILFTLTFIIFLVIKSSGIILSVFLNRLDYEKYYEIAINDYFNQKIESIKINNQFEILPIPNFTSFNRNPKKNSLLNNSLTKVNSLGKKNNNKIINGKYKGYSFSLGIITVRKTMKILKFLIILLSLFLIMSDSYNNSSKNYSNGYLGYWLLMAEIKKSNNYFFFASELPTTNEDEFNIVPKQNNFKKFIINYHERKLEGTEFTNIFDTNSTNSLTLRKIITPKTMIKIVDNANKYQEQLSMSIVNKTFTLLLNEYSYNKKENYQDQIFLPNIKGNKNIINCIDEIIEKIEIDLFHLEKSFNYFNSFIE